MYVFLCNDFLGDSNNPCFPVYINWYRTNKQEAEQNEMFLKKYINRKIKLKEFV